MDTWMACAQLAQHGKKRLRPAQCNCIEPRRLAFTLEPACSYVPGIQKGSLESTCDLSRSLSEAHEQGSRSHAHGNSIPLPSSLQSNSVTARKTPFPDTNSPHEMCPEDGLTEPVRSTVPSTGLEVSSRLSHQQLSACQM